MARKRKSKESKKDPKFVRAHNFRLELYADNPAHMRTLALIRSYRHSNGLFEYCGIWHTEKDESGEEIVKGVHKKHAHVLLHFDSAQRWLPLCVRFHIDERFCRPIGYDKESDTLEKGYVYLTHFKYPEKTQYSPHDIFGTWSAREKAIKANLREAAKGLTMLDCVAAITIWIDSQEDKIVSRTMLIKWVRTYTPYFKGLSHRFISDYLDEHNQAVRRKQLEVVSGQRLFADLPGAEITDFDIAQYDYDKERVYYG